MSNGFYEEWTGETKMLLTNIKKIEEPCYIFFDFSDIILDYNLININEEPKTIYSIYIDDLDLMNIHNCVRLSIMFYYKKINDLNIVIDNYNKIDKDYNKKRILYNNILRKQNELKSNELDKSWILYKNEVKDIFNEYIYLMSDSYKGEYINELKCNLDNNTRIKRRLDIIDKYILIINKYKFFKLFLTKEYKKKNICPNPNCLCELDKDNNVKETVTCKCGFVNTTIVNKNNELFDFVNVLQNSNLNVNTSSWEEWIDCYLCRDGKKYDKEELFEHFDKLCIENNLPRRDYVISGKLEQPNCSVILFLLKNTKIISKQGKPIVGSDFYYIKNSIRHEYYGWEKPTMTHQQEFEAKNLYINIISIQNEFKERKNNINNEIMGFYILNAIGVFVRREDFKIPSSKDTINYSNTLIKAIFEKLDIEFNYLL